MRASRSRGGAWLSTISFKTATGEGQAGAWLATSRATELPLTFSEGTELVMAPGSRGRVEELERTGASFLLERGEIKARVVHRSNTSWRFLAGPFEVHVTGTALGVEWDPARERFAVHVDEGAVVGDGSRPERGRASGGPGGRAVRRRPAVANDAHLAARAARVARGRRRRSGRGHRRRGPRWIAAMPRAAALPPSTQRPRVTAIVASASWSKLEEKGDYDAAYAAALSVGLASVLRASSADELLRLAQVARLSGHRDTEREALVTCRRRFPGSERAAVAAYELGRSSSPSEASSWFDTYLGEQPGGPLAREASGRLVEARASAGDDRGARDAAARYLARYPDGPHAPLARRVLAGAHE